MPGRVLDRQKRRMPCDLIVGGRRHTGLVLDLSPGGLFVQTNAKTQPGDVLDLELSIPGVPDKLPMHVEVVRKKVVPPRLLTVAHGGIGVKVLRAGEVFYQYVHDIGLGTNRELQMKEEPAWRVRVSQTSGSRTRTLTLNAATSDAARDSALAELGEGWKVMGVELI